MVNTLASVWFISCLCVLLKHDFLNVLCMWLIFRNLAMMMIPFDLISVRSTSSTVLGYPRHFCYFWAIF